MKTVNPDHGVYVEMPGVMEIRYTSDYDTEYPPEDMFGKSLYDTRHTTFFLSSPLSSLKISKTGLLTSLRISVGKTPTRRSRLCSTVLCATAT